MKRRTFMIDLTISKMGLLKKFGLLMLDLVIMDMVYLEMMSWIRKVILRTHGMWTQGIF